MPPNPAFPPWHSFTAEKFTAHIAKIHALIDRMRHFPRVSNEHRRFGVNQYQTSVQLLEILRDLLKQVDVIRKQNFILDDILSTAQRREIDMVMEEVDFERMQFANIENTLLVKIQDYENRV